MAKSVFGRNEAATDVNTKLVLSFETLGRAMDNLLLKQAQEHDLSTLQIRILILLQFKEEVASANLLVKQFRLSKATISVALRPLIEKKLLIKRRSEEDGRVDILQLTEWGSQIAHVAGFYLEPLHQIIRSLPNPDKESMLLNITGILGKLDFDQNK